MPEERRVLIVEDDDTFATVLARALRARGYDVRTAASKAEALESSRHWSPRAAIVDLKLGQESGLELVPLLVQEHPAIRILVLTGYASIATAVRAIKLGASDYLSKPAEIEDILVALSGAKPAPTEPVAAAAPSMRRLEWEHIQRVLTEHGGNISEAARTLGMHRRTLQRKLAKRPVKK
jgi:two-component system response regulator RegA